MIRDALGEKYITCDATRSEQILIKSDLWIVVFFKDLSLGHGEKPDEGIFYLGLGYTSISLKRCLCSSRSNHSSKPELVDKLFFFFDLQIDRWKDRFIHATGQKAFEEFQNLLLSLICFKHQCQRREA